MTSNAFFRLQIYTGSDTQFRVNGLDPKTEYSIRVGGVRVPVPGVEMSGQFSPPGVFTTAPSSSPVSSDQPADGQRKITTSRTGFIPHVCILDYISCIIYSF